LPLKRIPKDKFRNFLIEGFTAVLKHPGNVADSILAFTHCHPYYTQRLAYEVWEMGKEKGEEESFISLAIEGLLESHDIDYERIWSGFNATDKKVLIAFADNESFSLSAKMLRTYSLGPSSTAYSSLKRLLASGYIVDIEDNEEIDDPFFKEWIKRRREA
jgi:hypothetical protein